MDKEKEDKLTEKYLNSWKRERADFINYKKEEIERIRKAVEYNNEELILELLIILDNIYIAEKALPEGNSWAEGFLKIKEQILEFLRKYGVKQIECLGEQFNPHFQEVIEEVEKEDIASGIIIEEIKKGYFLNDKVLRPAMVKIVK
jgi:molecular chaperone GrpE